VKTVDLPQGRLGELAEVVEHGGQSELVRVYGGDLRALLAMRFELLARRRGADPFVGGKRDDLIAKAKAATTTAAQVLVPPADLRALLVMRAELLALEAAEQEQEQLESDALAAAGAKVIKASSRQNTRGTFITVRGKPSAAQRFAMAPQIFRA
jgi:hypothetical protein